MVKKIPSIKELRKESQDAERRKNQNLAGKISNYISIYITKLLLYTPITGNQVTFLMLLLALVSAIFFMRGIYVYTLIGILIFHLYQILDLCDGQIAKYRKQTSLRGGYLDLMTHIVANPLIILGMAIGAFFNNPLPIPDYVFLIAGFSGAYSYMINQFARLKKYELYIDKGEIKTLRGLRTRFKKGKEKSLKKALSTFFRIQDFGAIFFFGILNLLPYLVLIYGLVLPILAFSRFYSEYQKTETEVKSGDLDNKY